MVDPEIFHGGSDLGNDRNGFFETGPERTGTAQKFRFTGPNRTGTGIFDRFLYHTGSQPEQYL